MPKKHEYKVKVKIGDSEVEVEGSEAGVVKIVEALSGVLRGAATDAKASSAVTSAPSAVLAPRSSRVDIRTFFDEKHPSSDVEAAAVAAYYYQYLADEDSRKNAIDSRTLQDAFRLAKRPLPAKTIFTLVNARNSGYLDSAGEGQFKLNSVGYNLVEHTLGTSAAEPKRFPRTGQPKRFPRTARGSRK